MSRVTIKKLPPKEFAAIYKRVPRLSVDVIVKARAGIVLTKRSIPPWRGMWHIPGGTVYFGERLESAAMRTIYRETGLAVKITKCLGAIEYIHPEKGKRIHAVSVVLLAFPLKGTLRGSPEGEEVAYFSRIPKNIIAEQKQFLKTLSFPT